MNRSTRSECRASTSYRFWSRSDFRRGFLRPRVFDALLDEVAAVVAFGHEPIVRPAEQTNVAIASRTTPTEGIFVVELKPTAL